MLYKTNIEGRVMIKILVDTLGGDRSPDVNIDGAIMALNKFEDLQIVLVGNSEDIRAKLEGQTYDHTRLEILHAPDVISCNDKPTEAIRTKKESSLYVAFDTLRKDETVNGFVSNGSTGAILAGAVLRLGRIKGIKRPALCPLLPTMTGNVVAICDSGANMDCDSLMLHQFALMASLYIEKTYNIASPRVALLNVGTEEEKGDMLRKETYSLLSKDERINFVGNMESRDLLKGEYDVVVSDGFGGNVLCKSTEGACLEMLKLLKKTCTKSFKNKLGASFLKKDISEIKDFMDYNNYGGAVLLGANKTIVKAHGSCKAITIMHCIEQAYNIEKNNLRQLIEEGVSQDKSE